MGFESQNFGKTILEDKKSSNDSASYEKFPRFVRKAIIYTASLIALYGGEQKIEKHFAGKDYSSVGDFNSAFKKARSDNEKVFRWNGDRYTTDLVDKELSDNYWESKKFLEDYYSSDYYKSKHLPKYFDSVEILFKIQEDIENNPRYIELSKKYGENGLNNLEFIEFAKFNDALFPETISHSVRFKKMIDSLQSHDGQSRINNLKNPTSMSITHFKGKKVEDGSYNGKTKKVFIYQSKGSKDETTSIHELTHKSTNGNELINDNQSSDLRNKAYNLIKQDIDFISKYGQKGFDYLTDPTEIDARQNSTRFWLYKHFPGYTANTAFNDSHYNLLMKKYKNLPYDIKQLLDLFPDRVIFISNMNQY